MGLLGRRVVRAAPGAPEWLVRYLLEHVEPRAEGAEREAYFEMRFCDGPLGEREAWRQFEGELLARWVAAHPGTRPWAWWRYTAPQGRRQTSGAPIEAGALRDQVDDEGLPLALGCFERAEAVAFESQAACLKRLGLLSADEAQRLKPAAFGPEWVEVGEGEAA
jgi:hypothetical protein